MTNRRISRETQGDYSVSSALLGQGPLTALEGGVSSIGVPDRRDPLPSGGSTVCVRRKERMVEREGSSEERVTK